jgi:hypothetical protein
VFSTESESIVLTRDGGRLTQWLLDEAFESLIPKGGLCQLTFHPDETRWGREGEKVTLRAVNKGQEFVFDGDRHPMAKDYFVNRIKTVMSNKRERILLFCNLTSYGQSVSSPCGIRIQRFNFSTIRILLLPGPNNSGPCVRGSTGFASLSL